MTAVESRKRCFRWPTAVAAAIAVAGLVGAAKALAEPVDLQVVDRDSGRVLRVWRHDGRLFVAGEPGDRYALRVTNHTDRRVLIVMSVDGVNILTGETAGYDQDGYVFDPHESYEVTGWRKSTTEVAAFTFAPLPQSYAARTGRPYDVGVIGIAVFDERVVPPETVAPEPSTGHAEDSDRAPSGASDIAAERGTSLALPPPPALAKGLSAPAPAENALAGERRDEKLGTAHGAREWSEVQLVDFERATSWPQFVQQIEYDTHDHLVAMGVIPSWRGQEHRPQPFPKDGGFVPDPPG